MIRGSRATRQVPQPITRAAPRARSMERPAMKGPRWLIRTTTERPVAAFVTRTRVPKRTQGVARRCDPIRQDGHQLRRRPLPRRDTPLAQITTGPRSDPRLGSYGRTLIQYVRTAGGDREPCTSTRVRSRAGPTRKTDRIDGTIIPRSAAATNPHICSRPDAELMPWPIWSHDAVRSSV